jgi:hypothetical protein
MMVYLPFFSEMKYRILNEKFAKLTCAYLTNNQEIGMKLYSMDCTYVYVYFIKRKT